MSSKKKVAVIINSEYQLNQFKKLCRQHKFVCTEHKEELRFVCGYPKKEELRFPHHQMLMPIGNLVYSIYNEIQEDSVFSVREMGYFPLDLSTFERELKNGFEFKEDYYEK